MTEKDIMSILKSRRKYESEMLIIRDCSDELDNPDDEEYAGRFAILKRRKNLIDHWMHYLSDEERIVVQKHLIEGQSWKSVTAYYIDRLGKDDSFDPRTVQRAQTSAIKKLVVFMSTRFVGSLDFLIDLGEYGT